MTTKREKGLFDMKTAIHNAARTLDIEWPLSMLDDPMVNENRKMIVRTYRYDLAKLNQAAQVVDSILANADGFAVFFELVAKKPADFQALVVLAQIELARKPEAAAA